MKVSTKRKAPFRGFGRNGPNRIEIAKAKALAKQISGKLFQMMEAKSVNDEEERQRL